MDSLFLTFLTGDDRGMTTDFMWCYKTIKQLAKKLGRSFKELIVLAPQNDPYYIGSQTQREHAGWIAEIVDQFLEARGRGKVHDRAIHYYILSMNLMRPIDKDKQRVFKGDSNDFSWVMKSIQNARILDYTPWTCIEDKKNPELIQNAHYWTHNTIENLKITPEKIAKKISEEFYPFNPQLQQAYHVEIWTEKTTINDILEPISKRYGVNIQSFSGQATSTKVFELVYRISKINKPVRILYISDYDKSGHNMPVATGRKIQWFLDTMNLKRDVKLDKILLTGDQVKEYRLPSAPDAKNKVEIDALEVYHPNETRKIVEANVSKYMDLKLTQEIIRRNAEIQKAIYNAVIKQKDLIKELIEELNLNQLKPLFNNPIPKARTIDEANKALFDSNRDYLEQLKKFKQHLLSRKD